jgi:S-adenosylmethionine:tRNA ribosyltransferase-isomerase
MAGIDAHRESVLGERLCHHTAVRVSDFDFDLPDRLIAQHPRERGQSRMLVVDRARGRWEESRVADLAKWLRAGDLLVANDSRVFPARLLGKRQPGGGHAEVLLLELVADLRPAVVSSPQISYELIWRALVSPGARLQPGTRVDFTDDDRAPGIKLTGEILELTADGQRLVRLVATGISVADAIDALGHIPLPPYIRRPDTDDDRARYQTMFARLRSDELRRGGPQLGSIAAPTAGLHFDEALVAALDGAGIRRTTVTLHVGYGTFKPVKVEDTRDHRVDGERWEVSNAAANAVAAAREAKGRVIAIGTTTTRVLESAATEAGLVAAGSEVTELCITPGYQFQVIDGLLTNFHLPRSSLLMLVAAFAGLDLVLAAYRDAIAREFAFYSYGDAMLIL